MANERSSFGTKRGEKCNLRQGRLAAEPHVTGAEWNLSLTMSLSGFGAKRQRQMTTSLLPLQQFERWSKFHRWWRPGLHRLSAGAGTMNESRASAVGNRWQSRRHLECRSFNSERRTTTPGLIVPRMEFASSVGCSLISVATLQTAGRRMSPIVFLALVAGGSTRKPVAPSGFAK